MTDLLRQEHDSLQRAVKLSRRQFEQSPESAFAKAMREAMDDYSTMRQSGVAREDAVKGLEAVLRAMWPKPPSKFDVNCHGCEDTGWRFMACWDQQRCGRKWCAEHAAMEHGYVTACECDKGDRFRPRLYAPEDEIAAAGKVRKPKPRGFTRVGQ